MNPIPSLVRKLWDIWDVRLLILFSLLFQIILLVFGNKRKYMTSSWLRIVIWLAYLLADWVATVALGKLSDAQGDSDNINDPNNSLRSVWAPLLLLHLGGPDTITAYALEDNQLWLRHFLGLGVQIAVAVYVLLMSWRVSWFAFLTIPVFVSGILKYAERIWSLKSASEGQSGHIVPLGLIPPKVQAQNILPTDNSSNQNKPRPKYPDAEALVLAHIYCRIYKPHVAKYVFKVDDILQGPRLLQERIQEVSIEHAMRCWKPMEFEMGLMFDLLYTKATIVYTKAGSILRTISLSTTLTALLAFFLIYFLREKSHDYSIIDIAITSVLLVGAFILEMYAITLVLSADWTMLWLIKHHNNRRLTQVFQNFPWLFSMHKDRRWSSSMGQFNLLSFSMKRQPKKIHEFLNYFGIAEELDKFIHKRFVDVPQDLKVSIVRFLFKDRAPITNGMRALQTHNCHRELSWIDRSDYDERIIIWHIATEICYHHEGTASASNSSADTRKELCKLLSDYMVHLLVMCPSMLPAIILEDMLTHTVATLRKIFGGQAQELSQACQKLEEQPSNLGDEAPVITKARKLAEYLKGKSEGKWDILTSLWVEMCCYAASECPQNNHVGQLRQGGELLTVIWLLITQSGRSEKTRKAAMMDRDAHVVAVVDELIHKRLQSQ